MTLTLRRTVIAGDTLENDYDVREDGRDIGRIRLGAGLRAEMHWFWTINIPLPIPAYCSGKADTLDEAKDQFRKAWETFRATLTDERVERWHHLQDAAARNRPWQK